MRIAQLVIAYGTAVAGLLISSVAAGQPSPDQGPYGASPSPRPVWMPFNRPSPTPVRSLVTPPPVFPGNTLSGPQPTPRYYVPEERSTPRASGSATPAKSPRVSPTPAAKKTPAHSASSGSGSAPTPAKPKPKPSKTPDSLAEREAREQRENSTVNSPAKTPAPEKTEAAATEATNLDDSNATPAPEGARTAPGHSVAPAASTNTASPLVVTRWPTGKNLIALTYDDGPNPKFTPQFIELLKQKKVPATFFLCGGMVKDYPGIAQRLYEEGFELANHTWTHPNLHKSSEAQIRSELSRTTDIITSVTGEQVALMRPPYGNHNSRVDAICQELGQRIIIWDVDTEDWKGRMADFMAHMILKNASDGSIILFHDRLQTSLDATAQIIDPLRAKGFEFVTVGQLLSHPRVQPAQKASPTPTGSTTGAGKKPATAKPSPRASRQTPAAAASTAPDSEPIAEPEGRSSSSPRAETEPTPLTLSVPTPARSVP